MRRLNDLEGTLLCVVIIVSSLAFYFWFQGERQHECYAKGGVELVSLRDNICIDADGRVIR